MRLFFPLNKWFFCPFYNAMYNFFKKTEIQRTIKADIQVIDNDPQPLLLVFFFPCMSVKWNKINFLLENRIFKFTILEILIRYFLS